MYILSNVVFSNIVLEKHGKALNTLFNLPAILFSTGVNEI